MASVCRSLLQAVHACQQHCEHLVPDSFNKELLSALQQLVQQALQLQQEEQLQLQVRACLEASLQLLSRVGTLGPIEAFFVSDELLAHYQWRLDATHALSCRLCGASQQCTAVKGPAKAAAVTAVPADAQQRCNSSSSTCQLKLPDQQRQTVQSFRRQAAKVCPLLAASCTPAALQQLCDTVKHGLVLVNGHSFLLGQEWQAEVSAMLGRAEQLKVLLAHRQAHHLSLLASVFQILHQQEVQEFDRPRSASSSHGKQASTTDNSPQKQAQVLAGGVLLTGQLPSAQVFVLAGCDSIAGSQGEPEDDDFFMPVAPVGAAALPASGNSSSSPGGQAAAAAAAASLPSLPFHIASTQPLQRSGSAVSESDSLARTPSSGCSSLIEYVQSSMCPAAAATGGGAPFRAQHTQQQALQSIEQQLLSIAGSQEVAAVLAAALGFEQQPCSRSSSYCGSQSPSSSPTATAAAVAAAAGSFSNMTVRDSSICSGKSSPGHSQSVACAGPRVSSSTAIWPVLDAVLASDRDSSGGAAAQRLGHQSPQRQRWRWRRPQQPSSSLCLQHVHLPPGCCKSIGAVCYLCPHLKRVLLVDVGLTDQAVGQLVDALKVNSSVQHLDLSCNQVEDVGARVLASLLRPVAGCSSRLRTLHLQHNRIGDDGAAALAHALAGSSKLQRLWLQHNAIGEAGAQELCNALQHNTACTDLKLQPGNLCVPPQLSQTAKQLARQNRGHGSTSRGCSSSSSGQAPDDGLNLPSPDDALHLITHHIC